jgi:DNA-binding SARP family transcriptional activator
LLGPLTVIVDGEPVPIGGAKPRAFVSMLALHANRVVSVDSLIGAVWGDPAPGRAEHTLQQHVSSVRKLLAPEPSVAVSILATKAPGYALHLDTLDIDEFERESAVGAAAAEDGQWPDAVASFRDALAHWRGTALADARGTAVLDAAAVRLDEQRLSVIEMQIDARLECGESREVVPELEQMVVDHPLRERLHGQLMVALYRSGRQADALAAYRSARETLIDELGIEPGAALRDLEQAILEQRPDLDSPTFRAAGTGLRETYRASVGEDVGRIDLPDGQAVLLWAGTTLIGRDPAAQVRLLDSRVSRQHARIDVADGRVRLHDLASTNGTTVNGTPTTEQELDDGDVIGVGGVQLRYRRAGT